MRSCCADYIKSVASFSIHCRVKFGAFLEHLESAHAGRFDRVASGHYAGVTRDPATGAATLRTTADAVKDQTYFLAHLSQVTKVYNPPS
jgi:tRNA U34 2-thiouridine synthase MnmA/TrmU